MKKLIIISHSVDGLTPEIDTFYTNEKAVKHLGQLVSDEYGTKPDPDKDVMEYLGEYLHWVREENDNMCSVSVDVEIVELEDERFPNGFESWYETHHEVVEAMLQQADTDLKDCHLEYKSQLSKVFDEGGTGRMYEFAQEVTNEFEKLHKGREWDGEFMEEIVEFVHEKIK